MERNSLISQGASVHDIACDVDNCSEDKTGQCPRKSVGLERGYGVVGKRLFEVCPKWSWPGPLWEQASRQREETCRGPGVGASLVDLMAVPSRPAQKAAGSSRDTRQSNSAWRSKLAGGVGHVGEQFLSRVNLFDTGCATWNTGCHLPELRCLHLLSRARGIREVTRRSGPLPLASGR